MKPRISLSFYTRPAWSLAASGKLKKTYNYTKITAIILRPHTSPAGIPTQEIYLGSRCTAPYRLEWTFPHKLDQVVHHKTRRFLRRKKSAIFQREPGHVSAFFGAFGAFPR